MNFNMQNPIQELIAGSNNHSGTGGPFISPSSSGHDSGKEGFGVVRRVLKWMHHQRSLQMAAHAQTSQPQAVKQLQHVVIFKQARLKRCS